MHIGRKYPDLTNQQFGLLKVIKQDEYYIRYDKNGKLKRERQWLCECQCKNKTIRKVREYKLTSGYARSCGCMSKMNQFQKRYNKYDLSGDFGIGYFNDGSEFYFDLEDYEKIKDYCWNYTTGYVMHNSTNCDDEHDIDHINHNTRDNRKINLRIVTTQQNCMNQKNSKNNTSGYSGVYRIGNKWVSTIGYRNNTIRLGTFNNKDDAILARKIAEETYYKEFSYDNSMKLMEGK